MARLGRSKAAQAERQARLERYRERLRAELIDRGALPDDLVGLGAARLSELVIVARRHGRRGPAGDSSRRR